MRRALRILALVLVVGAAGYWAAVGANRGWTKTSVQVKTLDEVTGIEGVEYRDQFVPGIDFIGAGLLAGGLLAGISFLIRKPKLNA